MKKIISVFLAVILLFTVSASFADSERNDTAKNIRDYAQRFLKLWIGMYDISESLFDATDAALVYNYYKLYLAGSSVSYVEANDTLTHSSFADDSFADTLASASIAIYKAQMSYSEDVDTLWRNYIEGKTSYKDFLKEFIPVVKDMFKVADSVENMEIE